MHKSCAAAEQVTHAHAHVVHIYLQIIIYMAREAMHLVPLMIGTPQPVAAVKDSFWSKHTSSQQ